MARVLLEKVTKDFGEHVAVKEASLDIEDKEFLILVGPSGCGKSTTLRMVAGLEEITTGNIYIGDQLVNDVPPKDRDIAMVFQNYALYPHMDVYNNMAFGLKLRKMPKDEIEVRVNEAARILGIENLLKRKPKQLSGGQRQRVALGRAIVRQPKVFLMDEPLSNLDAKLRVQMRAELQKLHDRLQTTIIYVTHDQTEAMTMGDRLVVMDDGYIMQVDSPIRLYHYPNNMFVAGFIGSPAMNFVPGQLIKDEGGYVIKGQDFRLALPEEKITEEMLPYVGQDVVMGIRPEDIYDATLKQEIEMTESNKVNVLVEVIEPMGAESFIYIKVGGETLTARVDVATSAVVGKTLEVAFDMSMVHVFEPKNQKNISLLPVSQRRLA